MQVPRASWSLCLSFKRFSASRLTFIGLRMCCGTEGAAVACAQEGSEQLCTAWCKNLSDSFEAASLRLVEVFSEWQERSALPIYGPGWAVAASLVYSTAWAALWLQSRAAVGKKGKKAKQQSGSKKSPAEKGGSEPEPLKFTEAAAAALRQALLQTTARLQVIYQQSLLW